MKRVVIASNNPGKLRELSSLLDTLGLEAIAQSGFGITEAAEPHGTFIENALAKARHAAALTKLPAIADDSGLCVHALAGDPGVQSACYAGTEGDRAARDARNNAKLVAELAGVPDRSAYYYCVLVLVRFAEDPCPVFGDGLWHGEIVLEARGTRGFGYDAHFLLPVVGRTAAELFNEEKNRVSHRARAMAALAARLNELQPAED